MKSIYVSQLKRQRRKSCNSYAETPSAQRCCSRHLDDSSTPFFPLRLRGVNWHCHYRPDWCYSSIDNALLLRLHLDLTCADPSPTPRTLSVVEPRPVPLQIYLLATPSVSTLIRASGTSLVTIKGWCRTGHPTNHLQLFQHLCLYLPSRSHPSPNMVRISVLVSLPSLNLTLKLGKKQKWE